MNTKPQSPDETGPTCTIYPYHALFEDYVPSPSTIEMLRSADVVIARDVMECDTVILFGRDKLFQPPHDALIAVCVELDFDELRAANLPSEFSSLMYCVDVVKGLVQ